jgi:hypothetical protein
MKNANTTILGVLTIIASLVNAAVSYMTTGSCDMTVVAAGLFAGWGLIKAKDAQ